MTHTVPQLRREGEQWVIRAEGATEWHDRFRTVPAALWHFWLRWARLR